MCKEIFKKSNKRIATLSFQHAYNYGAVFQVAALQYIIESLGVDCDIIDYRCSAIDSQYNFTQIKITSLLSSIRSNLVLLPFIKAKKKNFRTWMDSYKKTEIINNKEQLSLLNDRYDKFVVGSDQVWNLKCHGYDTSFFLDFVNDSSKKVAYAASFGTFDIKEEDKVIYKKYINDFSAISVRETRGIELVKLLSNRDSIACMDPVLLVGREYWKSKANHTNIPLENEYIFVYQLGHAKLLPDYVKSLKRKTKLKVVYITGHIGNMIHYTLFDKNESSASPERFLGLLSHAKYVITNSFHATVLSILFKKDFFVVSKGGEKATYNSRIYNLLADYNLVNCIVDKFNVNHLDFNRKYDDIYNLIKQNSIQSINFIKNSLKL